MVSAYRLRSALGSLLLSGALASAAIGAAPAARAAGFVGFSGTIASGAGMQGSFGTVDAAKATVGGAAYGITGVQVSPSGIVSASRAASNYQGVSTKNAFTSAQVMGFAQNQFAPFGGIGF